MEFHSQDTSLNSFILVCVLPQHLKLNTIPQNQITPTYPGVPHQQTFARLQVHDRVLCVPAVQNVFQPRQLHFMVMFIFRKGYSIELFYLHHP